ncbi:somatostatin receptor type 2-like, partial [Chrysoperla carnea]|uniref:somatostatin receptor type 2-like n=1 Tax=Chrysoperla carnea TaxID=189513 RepID=UPI001D0906D7
YPNDTTNYTYTCPKYNFPIVILLTQIVYAFVCVLGLLGNTLVIYVVLRFSKMQTVTNMYIVNLAIADECFLIGIPFLITTMSLQRWIFGEIMCKVYMITTSINQFTSSMFLFIMSADRYIAVCHPISSPKLRTPFISRIVAAAAWTMSALFMVPISIYSKTITVEKTTCLIVWPSDMGNPQKTFTLYSFILGFAMPLTMILIFYCLVIQKLQTVGPKNKSKEKKRSHRKVTKLVLTVITVYAFCWFPYWIAQMALMFGPETEECQSRMTVFFFLLTGCLSYSNSAMNPVLYAFLSDNFKKSFLKACTCAAGKDVNATLHMENSVFPRRQHKANSDRLKPALGSQACLNRGGTTGNSGNAGTSNEDDDGEQGPLVSKADHSTSAMTMTSRSNITISTDTSKDGTSKDGSSVSKNGVLLTLHPTQV